MREKQCLACGAIRTLKGNPLSGNYCSPVCLGRSSDRIRPRRDDIHSLLREGRPLSQEKPADPFPDLFDNSEDD